MKSTDFFVSFSNRDKEWADWIAWTLDQEGYSILYQPWNFGPGSNFVLGMNAGASASKTIAVLSENYLASTFTQPEWAAAFAQDPTGSKQKLIPIRISECDLEGTLLAQIVYIDLVGIFDKDLAQQKILDGLTEMKPSERPEEPFPSTYSPPFPGTIADPATRSTTLQSSTLPPPGIKIPVSPPYIPPTFRGIQVHPENPLVLDFILDSGDASFTVRDLAEVSFRLTKYFLTSLTIPDEHLWVNLSPHEENQIIPDDFGRTQMGIDLLGQDYVLKQLTSSLIFPEKQSGQDYWSKMYEDATEEESEQDAVNTFNKVWITPDQAKIAERGTLAVIESSHLKVQMERDYLALKSAMSAGLYDLSESEKEVLRIDAKASDIYKSVVLPELEDDVNSGGNFAVLRQIYSSLILAVWYKEVLKRSIITDLYIDQNKTSGLSSDGPNTVNEIFKQYLEAYNTGVFNYIREDTISVADGDMIPRKYFAGGFTGVNTTDISQRNSSSTIMLNSHSNTGRGQLYWVRVNLSDEDADLLDDKFKSIDQTGGIDLSTERGFVLDIDTAGRGIEFQLSDEIIERLHNTGMRRLNPNLVLVKLIKGSSLEISDKTVLSEKLIDPEDDTLSPKGSGKLGLISKIKRILNIIRE